MTKKRKQPSDSFSVNGHGDSIDTARPPPSRPQVDPTYGQRNALPNIDNGDNDAESTEEALAYLRDVRTEASTIPTLLTAIVPPEAEDEDISSDTFYLDYPSAYYSDGAYVAVPPLSSVTPSHHPGKDSVPIDPQEAYYAALLTRYRTLSSRLSTLPIPSSSSSPPQPDPRATILSKRQTTQWRGKLLKTAPTTAILTQLDQETVVFGLEVLGEVLVLGNLRVKSQCRFLGAWGWGLLGRCREVGCLESEEVGVLRALGKQAAWVGRRVCVEGRESGGMEEVDGVGFEEDGEVEEEPDVNGKLDELAHEVVSGGGQQEVRNGDALSNDDGKEDNDIEAHRNRLLASLGMHGSDDATDHEKEPEVSNESALNQKNGIGGEREQRMNYQDDAREETPQAEMLATVDAIVTIVGEAYEQKDLLDARVLWNEI